MAKKEEEHIIERHIVNLEIEGTDNPDEIEEIQQNIVYFIKDRLGEELDKILNKLMLEDVEIQLDDVEVDIEDLSFKDPAELEKKIVEQFKAVAEKVIRQKVDTVIKQKVGFKGKKKRFSKVFILETFLKTGLYPAWASPTNGTIKEIIDELLVNRPNDFIKRLYHLANNDKVKERLYHQFSLEQLKQLFKLYYGKNTAIAQRQIDLIKKRFGSKAEKTIFAAAIQLAFGKKKQFEFKEKEFNQQVVKEIQGRKIKALTPTKIRAGYEGQYKDFQIIDYFLQYGAIPAWSSVENAQSLQGLFQSLLDHELIQMQSVVEARIDNKNFTKRLIYQFSTKSILQLLEPITADNVTFIEDCIKGFSFLSEERTNIQRNLTKNNIRAIVLESVLDYFFRQGRVNLVKKSLIRQLLKSLATHSRTEVDVLLKESYKSNRRKKSSSIAATLKSLDTNLQDKLKEDRKALKSAKNKFRQLQRSISKLEQKQKVGFSKEDLAELRRLERERSTLDKTIEGLEDLDMPLEIELLAQHQQDLKLQLNSIDNQQQDALQKKLDASNKEMAELQQVFQKEIDNLLRDKEKLKEKIGTIAENRIKRVNKRLYRYQRAAKNVIAQFLVHQKDLVSFLGDIKKALRGTITAAEKAALRQQRKALQDELLLLNNNIEALRLQESALKDTVQTALDAVNEDELSVESTPTSKLDALVFMLKYGSTPWWAKDFPRQTISELFEEFSRESPDKLKGTFQQIGKYPVVWERVINQLSEGSFRQVVKNLYPTQNSVVFAMADLLDKLHFSQGFEQLKGTDRKKFKWGLLFEYLLSNKKSFSAANLYRDISLQTARLYQLAPRQLLEYSFNIIKQKKGDLQPFEAWNRLLTKDKELAAVERELIVQKRKQLEKEMGLDLTDAQKLALLTEYLANGYINDKAKKFQYNNAAAFEKLLFEQIQKNKESTKTAISKLLRLANARTVLVKELSPAAFWELVYLIKPKAYLLTQRYFKDFARMYEDPNLYAEKDALLLFFNTNQQNSFEISEFLKALLMLQKQHSGRKTIGILLEWKQKILQKGGAKSSWLLSLLMLEIQVLKETQKNSTDQQVNSNLQQQMEGLAKDYTDYSKAYSAILAEENAESYGLPDKAYKLSDLDQLIAKLEEQVEQLKAVKMDALQSIEKNRKLALAKVQIKLLKQQRPPLLRAIETDLSNLQRTIDRLDQQIATEQEVAQEALEEAPKNPLSLKEQQLEMLDYIISEADSAFGKMDALLKQLSNKEQSNSRFLQGLETAILGCKDPSYQAKALKVLQPYLKNVKDIQVALKNAKIDEGQRKLLQQIGQTSPSQLWKQWDALDAYYQNNLQGLTEDVRLGQTEIYNELLRIEQQNILALARTISEGQQQLMAELTSAKTLEDLESIAQRTNRLNAFQLGEIDNLLKEARNNSAQKDLTQMRQNIRQAFVGLENERKRYAYSIHNKTRIKLLETKAEKQQEKEEKEQEKAFILDEIEKIEALEEPKEAVVKKSKRKKKPPVPQEVKEPLIIYNAGLVLLWPYLSRLFKALKYVDKKEFVSIEAQYKAIHLLQYLATGKTQAPENELLLNKVFCKFPISEPVPFGVEFLPGELKMAEGLLMGAIKNWPKMKSMSPNSFRGSFLIREGTIEETEDRWLIHVTKKPFDVLLKSLPWGFTFINLPWLQKFVSVEWKLL